MKHSDTIGNIAAALAKAQAKMKAAPKDSRNPHYSSRYADLASIVDACEGPLAENEIARIQDGYTTDAGLVTMVTRFIHSSGEWIESEPLTVQAKDAGPQAVGSCLTYLRRYQLAGFSGVAPADDDANAAEGRTVAPSKPPVRSPLPNANKLPPPKIYPDKKDDKRTWSNPVPEAPPITDKDIPF